MKHLKSILWLVAVLSAGSLQAQSFDAKASTSFTVWTVEGQAHYTEKGSTEKTPVQPGMSLQNDATVNLGESSSIRMINGENLVSLTGNGDYQLASDLKKNTAKQSAATSGFFSLLAASAKFYGTKVKATDDGSGYGDGKKKQEEGSGYGDGKKKQEEGSGYGDGKKKQEEGSGYGTKKAAKSKIKSVLSSLKSDQLYRGCKKAQKILMQAATLEKAGLISEANKYYKKALAKNPGDPIANQLYAAFLSEKN